MILDGLKSRILFSIADRKNVEQPERIPCSLRKANSIGILFDAQDQHNREAVIAFYDKLKNSNKDVQLLGYVQKRDPEATYHFPYLTPSDVTWYSKRKGGTAGYFIKYPFDLLINLCTYEHLPFEYISAISRANFRIGAMGKGSLEHYDFLIAGLEGMNEQKMIDNIEKYFA